MQSERDKIIEQGFSERKSYFKIRSELEDKGYKFMRKKDFYITRNKFHSKEISVEKLNIVSKSNRNLLRRVYSEENKRHIATKYEIVYICKLIKTHPTGETEVINDRHPIYSDYHETYQQAEKMIGYYFNDFVEKNKKSLISVVIVSVDVNKKLF